MVDGNNFYVSCERVFQPRLQGRAVVVLSNNDGCAIARSNEAKDMGIAMGAPWHQIRPLERSHGLIALSANFALYGDMSERMMALASALGYRQDVYSIDECFIHLHGVSGDLHERAQQLRQHIRRSIGIPCGIGLGSTPTRAKLANHLAKLAERHPHKYPAELAQVCDLERIDQPLLHRLLQGLPISAVWGVGRKLAPQLQSVGVHTVLDLLQSDAATMGHHWSSVLERTVRELQGTPCLDWDALPQPKQQIAYTRSFGRTVTAQGHLQEAVSEYTARAAEKLRHQHSAAGAIGVYIRTSAHQPNADERYSRGLVMTLPQASQDSAVLIGAALRALERIYQPGYRYAKAGVHLLDLQDAARLQLALPWAGTSPERPGLMQTLDSLNQRFGQTTVQWGSAGLGGRARPWSMRQERRTPAYTTRWAELPTLHAPRTPDQ
nr:Y-family DNA polymerase [Curvibacter sp. CHRR-16]